MSKQIISIICVLAMHCIMLKAAPPIAGDGVVYEQPIEIPINAESTIEHFTLGGDVDGAIPIFSYQNVTTYDDMQDEITINIDYPPTNMQNDGTDDSLASSIITQVSVYLEATNGFDSQVVVKSGGIGERTISLDIVANNLNTIRYMIIIYGNKVE